MSKTWFITGASSGLGLEMTTQLLVRGDTVIGTVRREGPLTQLKEQYGEQLTIVTLDLTDLASIRSAITQPSMASSASILSSAMLVMGFSERRKNSRTRKSTSRSQPISSVRSSLSARRCLGCGTRVVEGGIVQVSSEGGQIAYPNFSLYHATKWGIEGFVESVALEVASFGIDFIIAEPGPTVTNFGAGLDHADPMEAYEATPAGDVRRAIASGAFVLKGDAKRTVAAMIATADMEKPPLRLTLGSTAYASISTELDKRLRALEDQKDIAFSADHAN